MSRKVVIICCFALAYANSLDTEYPSHTAVSYSSIRFGSSSIEKNPAPIAYDVLTTSPLFTPAYQNYKTLDGNQQNSYSTLDTTNTNIKSVASSKTAPKYTEVIFPRYIPSGRRVLNLAKPLPTSRNIPVQPSPEFATVPSVLMTAGLSAYASLPVKSSVPEVYSAPMKAKGVSSYGYTSSQPAQAFTYSDALEPTSKYYSESIVKKSEGLSSLSFLDGNETRPVKVDLPESTVSHVSVSSSGIHYSW